ncbi:hypothetical protein ABT121_44490 [Streptomyces sp. NPDC001928]
MRSPVIPPAVLLLAGAGRTYVALLHLAVGAALLVGLGTVRRIMWQ